MATQQRNLFKRNIYLLTILCIPILLIMGLKALPIRFNDTPSMPIGLYDRVKAANLHRGEIVSVCLPKNIAMEGVKRGYLRHGSCPGNAVPVLKQIIAIPHDTIIVTQQSMVINHHRYWAPHELVDHNGKTVKTFIHTGTFKNTTQYWLYGAHDPLRSWDSRYYGGVARTNIQGIYRPLLIF